MTTAPEAVDQWALLEEDDPHLYGVRGQRVEQPNQGQLGAAQSCGVVQDDDPQGPTGRRHRGAGRSTRRHPVS